MPEPTSGTTSTQAKAAAHLSWAYTDDRSARTSPARAAFDQRFYDQVDPERRLTAAERERRAASARRAYFLALAAKSTAVRRERSGGDR